jgi:hypothetical protein
MRIGELLVEQRQLASSELARALEHQRRDGRRLVSMLIASGQLDYDTGSRALGKQRGTPSLLHKHLAARDPRLAELLPAELGRGARAIPVGRSSSGTLVVAVRDPSPELQAEVARVVRGKAQLVIAPASTLEALIADAYGPAPHEDFEVDLGSAANLPPAPSGRTPPLPDIDALDPESVRLALTDLDDARVAKEASARGRFVPKARAPTLPPAPPTLEATQRALETARTRDQASDAAMAFIRGAWVSSVIVAFRGELAVGYRGHGPDTDKIDQLAIPIGAATTLQDALATKRCSIRLYDSGAQKELATRLGSTSMAAAPVLVNSQAVAAILVGEPVHALGQTDGWIAVLGQLARMLGDAYQRIHGGR